jgi:hypothetical protein
VDLIAADLTAETVAAPAPLGSTGVSEVADTTMTAIDPV